METVNRAQFWDKVMTAVFYVVALFFLLLLAAFALYIIIKGFGGNNISLIFKNEFYRITSLTFFQALQFCCVCSAWS